MDEASMKDHWKMKTLWPSLEEHEVRRPGKIIKKVYHEEVQAKTLGQDLQMINRLIFTTLLAVAIRSSPTNVIFIRL